MICRAQLGQSIERAKARGMDWQHFGERLGKNNKGSCPTCGKRLIAGAEIASWKRKEQNSIAERPRSGYVQQDVRADLVEPEGRPEGQVLIFFSGVRPLN